MKMEDGCYRLVTRVLTSEDRNSMSYVDSESTCSNLGGTVAEATPGVITHLTKWLGLWRIGEETGRIFLLQKSNNTICQYIEVNVVIKLLTDDVQSQAVVTAYLVSKQLPLLDFALLDFAEHKFWLSELRHLNVLFLLKSLNETLLS